MDSPTTRERLFRIEREFEEITRLREERNVYFEKTFEEIRANTKSSRDRFEVLERSVGQILSILEGGMGVQGLIELVNAQEGEYRALIAWKNSVQTKLIVVVGGAGVFSSVVTIIIGKLLGTLFQ